MPIDGSIGGEAVVDRLTPVSLNLHYGTRGRVRFVISGGVSYMPATTIVATAGITLQLGGVPVPSLTLPDVAVTAAATLESSVGGNVGAGVRVPMGGSVSLLFDGRVFGFPERTLEWGRTSGTPSPIEDALLTGIR